MKLMQASNNWASRPSDERFTSLDTMLQRMTMLRRNSAEKHIATRDMTATPVIGDNRGLQIVGPNGVPTSPTHWAFTQLANKAGGSAGYLRKLPAPLAADCINYGLQFMADNEDTQLLLRRDLDGGIGMHAVTGPKYGRIWNADVVGEIVNRLGDGTGRDTPWSVPGHFGKPLEEITKSNTTLFASDRDMFVFLADEQNRIEIPGRRAGMMGSFARGVFFWNSEVGNATFGMASFLFDYTCCNRIVWGATEYKEVKIRHSSNAPSRFLEEITPALDIYAHGSTRSIKHAITMAQNTRCDINGGDVSDFLAKRFGPRMVPTLQAIHQLEEGKPIESLFDAVTAATAHARNMVHQDARIELETAAGKILDLVS